MTARDPQATSGAQRSGAEQAHEPCPHRVYAIDHVGGTAQTIAKFEYC